MKAKSRQYNFLLSANEKSSLNIDGVNIKNIVKYCRLRMLATYYLRLVLKVCVKGPGGMGPKVRWHRSEV